MATAEQIAAYAQANSYPLGAIAQYAAAHGGNLPASAADLCAWATAAGLLDDVGVWTAAAEAMPVAAAAEAAPLSPWLVGAVVVGALWLLGRKR